MSPGQDMNKNAKKLEMVTATAAGAVVPAAAAALPPASIIKPSLKRFVILLLFCLNTGNKSFQWIQVPASTTKATVFYGVESYVINFASIIFMLSFVVVSWPACYAIQRIGVRKAILLASLGTIIGSTVKCCSCYQDGVWLLLLGQVIISLSEQLVHQIPPRIASLWFPDSQVSSCVATCMLGNQLGIGVGFLVPQWLLQDAFTRDEIGVRLYQLFLITLAYSSALFVANWLFFDEAPAHAPGLARQRQMAFEKDAKETDAADGSVRQLFAHILKLYKNRDLVLISIVFGIGLGRGDTIATLLDQMINPIYPGNATLVGNVGFIVIAAGALGSPVWGRLIDTWRAYKKLQVIIALATSFSLVLFAYALIWLRTIWIIYSAAGLFGFFQSGLFVCCIEFAIELTYPAPEMITSSIMFIMSSTLGPIFILIGSYVVDNYGALATNIFYLIIGLMALVCVCFCRERLRRQEAIELQRASGAMSRPEQA